MDGKNKDPLIRLANLLGRLPGIGEKTAIRLALALVKSEPEYAQTLAAVIGSVHDTLKLCKNCNDLSADDICPRCSDPRRDHGIVCVIAQPQDRMALERSSVYRGVYHVLHGVLDPLAGVGPNELRLSNLMQRLEPCEERPPVREIIIATSPNVEGDATALYLAKLISPLGIRVTRIASGIAVGGELEYADMTSLHRAFEDRRDL